MIILIGHHIAKLWLPRIWHAIQFIDVVDLAPGFCVALLVMAEVIHCECGDAKSYVTLTLCSRICNMLSIMLLHMQPTL